MIHSMFDPRVGRGKKGSKVQRRTKNDSSGKCCVTKYLHHCPMSIFLILRPMSYQNISIWVCVSSFMCFLVDEFLENRIKHPVHAS